MDRFADKADWGSRDSDHGGCPDGLMRGCNRTWGRSRKSCRSFFFKKNILAGWIGYVVSINCDVYSHEPR